MRKTKKAKKERFTVEVKYAVVDHRKSANGKYIDKITHEIYDTREIAEAEVKYLKREYRKIKTSDQLKKFYQYIETPIDKGDLDTLGDCCPREGGYKWSKI